MDHYAYLVNRCVGWTALSLGVWLMGVGARLHSGKLTALGVKLAKFELWRLGRAPKAVYLTAAELRRLDFRKRAVRREEAEGTIEKGGRT